jgi:thiosulfate/3-mercaptopyruvate sulfurtransferase
VLDVRWRLGGPPGQEEYAKCHIPGAVFVDLDEGLAGPPGPRGRHPLPDVEEFAAGMREAGVSGGRPVVVYDGIAAARAWWLLRYFGHSDVAVLDGGLEAWVAAGHPLERDEPATPPGDFFARPGGMALLDAEGAAAVAEDGVLIDARAPERFRGESEPVDRVAGHIPGAHNRPAPMNIAEAGQFREPDALRREFEAMGIREGAAVGAYCGSGVAAAQEVLALELAGFPAALYVGSWSEWIADPSRPVATGA